ncbi:hypothetical protein ACLB2K_063868 [Fragaria x ananassa]
MAASAANYTMPADDELPFSSSSPSPYSEPPESGGDASLSSDASEYSPPPPPPYIDALAAEEAQQLNLSPDYSPSPAPYFTQYHSSPPYVEVEAPEVYELYTPTQAPAPEPSSVFGSEPLSDTEPIASSPDSDMDPNPTVLPSNYRAEDESVEFDDEYYSSEQSKNRVTMVGFVLGAVCVVGLAGAMTMKVDENCDNADDLLISSSPRSSLSVFSSSVGALEAEDGGTEVVIAAALGFDSKVEAPVHHHRLRQNMASASNRGQGGIQQLLAAEQVAQHIVNAARNAKLARLKQAKDEAGKEIVDYRAQVEREFQKKLAASSGDSGANVKRLEVETAEKINHLSTEGSRISGDVVKMLLKQVTTVKN